MRKTINVKYYFLDIGIMYFITVLAFYLEISKWFAIIFFSLLLIVSIVTTINAENKYLKHKLEE